ncbi:hypothetical protein [Streptomyces sp. NBC_01092]|uniref:hypothetical protein n=1 Tax=Streptomyces sp. NBC_01092 TaxID=2903748 RepID=UPI0038637505|nr:hypothetical protein OG254_14265 [Streptomyces sp. NBC_01092]
MDRKTIKRRLRELAADPGQPGAAAEIQRLRGELLRERGRTGEEPPARPAPEPAPADPDAEAIATWPPELRARLRTASMSRKIDRASSVHDPGSWGALNDLRRR